MSQQQKTEDLIEEQRLKIEKYEGKLRALIQAYKSLMHEKNALEQTVKALSNGDDELSGIEKVSLTNNDSESAAVHKQPGGCVLVDGETSSLHSNETLENAERKHDDDAESVCSTDTEGAGSVKTVASAGAAEQLKLATLKNAIAALTTEKARQETAFTDDRKRLIKEKEDIQLELEKYKQEFTAAKELFEVQKNELKANLVERQKDRDREQANYAAMLKEIQANLTKERYQIEQLEKTVNSLNNELSWKDNEIARLSAIIDQLNFKITDYEKKYDDAFNIEKLQAEFNQFKVKSGSDLELGQKRLIETQSEITRIRNQNEELIGSLEKKIADLTSILSDCEKHKLDYVEKLEKLQHRIFTLEQENFKINSSHFVDDKNYTVLAGKCRELIVRLRSIDPNGDILNILGLSDIIHADSLHEKCRKDYETLRDDFEQYKIRMQLLLKSKNIVKTTMTDVSEIENLRQTVCNLEQKLAEVQYSLSEQESQYKIQLNSMKENYSRELIQLEQTCQRRIAEFENEMQKQRERTQLMLTEKERELIHVRSLIDPGFQGVGTAGGSADICLLNNSAGSARCDSRTSYNSAEELSATLVENGDPCYSATPVDPAPSTALHLNRELARKDKEIITLRLDLRRIEGQLVEVQHGIVTKELMHHELQEKLKDEIRKSEARLARCGETAQNMEYIKNVFVQFALSNDPTCKQHMLKAIGYALKLNNREMDDLMKNYAAKGLSVKKYSYN